MSHVVTRFAPSPTGALHLGGARTAVFSWLYARAMGGSFRLRVEDTDLVRSLPEHTASILSAMKWLGLDHDGEIVYQSQRFDRYNQAVDELLARGAAYHCHCSADAVEADREAARAAGKKPKYSGRCRDLNLGPAEGSVVRLRAPLAGTTVVHDLVRGAVAFENAELDDMVVRRSDGSPTYNLAVVVDDSDMGVTHVIRGDDHLSNTPKQILIYEALGLALPAFGHVPMILGPDKKKLSKRHGATAVIDYEAQGILPEALLNSLVRLGWSHGDQEFFTVDELIKLFDIKNLGKSASVFNVDKLMWLNAEHLRAAPVARLAELTAAELAKKGLPDADVAFLAKLMPLLSVRAKSTLDLAEGSAPFVTADEALVYDEAAVAKFLTAEGKAIVAKVSACLEKLTDFSDKDVEAALNELFAAENLTFKQIAQPVRVALMGRTVSPGLTESMAVLGKKRTLARLAKAAA